MPDAISEELHLRRDFDAGGFAHLTKCVARFAVPHFFKTRGLQGVGGLLDFHDDLVGCRKFFRL